MNGSELPIRASQVYGGNITPKLKPMHFAAPAAGDAKEGETVEIDIVMESITPTTRSMSSIKRDVKKKVLPRPEGEVSVSRSSPL